MAVEGQRYFLLYIHTGPKIHIIINHHHHRHHSCPHDNRGCTVFSWYNLTVPFLPVNGYRASTNVGKSWRALIWKDAAVAQLNMHGETCATYKKSATLAGDPAEI
jgi:hypothetical protein